VEGTPVEVYEGILREIADGWGGPVGIDFRAPSRVNDARFCDNWARYLRAGASPGAAIALTKMNGEIDVRGVLPSIRVPTLVLHRTGDRAISVRAGRSMAEAIPGAAFVELPGDDHLPWVGDSDRVLSEIEAFLTGVRGNVAADRVLGTVLFTDIVGSTERAAEIGDLGWRDLLEAHNARVRREFERFDGREAKTTGDGFLATFDGPARAVRCANAITQTVREIGIEVRAGLHTGEIEFVDGEVHGIAVHIGARVAALAGAGEVLVSSTVKDLIAGSGLEFADRGEHVLKGVPGAWRVFALLPG
jgi:class 3 adenylate cyclase